MRSADLDEVVAIAAASPQAPQWRRLDYAAYLALHPEPPLLRVALVADRGEKVAGFAAATLLLDGDQNRCELDSMAVHPAARRMGLGAALLGAVVAWARKNGARRIALEVRAGNLAALRLYQRSGLQPEGRRPRYYADPEEDALLLGAEITLVPEAVSFSTDKAVEGGPPRC
jgi:ribosomal-protein-alanine N-acetyltransferase